MDENQKDWDEYAERLTYSINTAYDRIRGDTPFYLIHGWDPRSTLEATLPLGSTKSRNRDARRWRYGIQSQYQRARAVVNDRLEAEIKGRADRRNEDRDVLDVDRGSRVWMYLDRVKEGYARNLAHIWHGPFSDGRKVRRSRCKVENCGYPYRLFPMITLLS